MTIILHVYIGQSTYKYDSSCDETTHDKLQEESFNNEIQPINVEIYLIIIKYLITHHFR